MIPRREHGWLPREYQDEIIPPARDTPDDWITMLNDGAPALASGGGQTPGRGLKDGEIVEFDEYTDYGIADLIVHADGSWTADPPMPAAANCVRYDFENVFDGIEQLVVNGGDWGDEQLAPGTYDIDYFHWTDEPIEFRFDAASRQFARIERA